MRVLEYRLVKSKIPINNKVILLYGIEAVRRVVAVPNISTNKKKVEELIKLCNEGNLSPVHLNDVIQDNFGA